jgi:hypothetical protein
MPLHHPIAYKLAADLDRLANDPQTVAARADAIRLSLATIERDHPADSECVAYLFRAKLALDRLAAALAGQYPFVAAFDLQQLREAVYEAVSVSRGVVDD